MLWTQIQKAGFASVAVPTFSFQEACIWLSWYKVRQFLRSSLYPMQKTKWLKTLHHYLMRKLEPLIVYSYALLIGFGPGPFVGCGCAIRKRPEAWSRSNPKGRKVTPRRHLALAFEPHIPGVLQESLSLPVGEVCAFVAVDCKWSIASAIIHPVPDQFSLVANHMVPTHFFGGEYLIDKA